MRNVDLCFSSLYTSLGPFITNYHHEVAYFFHYPRGRGLCVNSESCCVGCYCNDTTTITQILVTSVIAPILTTKVHTVTSINIVLGTTTIATTIKGTPTTITTDVTSLIAATTVATVTATNQVTVTVATTQASTVLQSTVVQSTYITTVSDTVYSTVISTVIPLTTATYLFTVGGSTVTTTPQSFVVVTQGSAASALVPCGLASMMALIVLTVVTLNLRMS
ncbi:hypothetical protein BC936DRAFT_141019 [Jimgerdemannia flammicorona]|uniref:Uncharacterized protein n=1 Tax=Jimgerdemannia flammicorona TaxID=994334 RepID=A0A433DGD5_9FUNG|nr:hypothetical protein BC936DRAFT_141019 [Jimgerdemannia flammicorona]